MAEPHGRCQIHFTPRRAPAAKLIDAACTPRECGGQSWRASLQYTWLMIRQIVPLFFTTDIRATLAYYQEKLGFECLGTWQDPPVYAIVARDRQAIHFRCADPPTPNPGMQPRA